jgi:AcrR family transcriptional regulator
MAKKSGAPGKPEPKPKSKDPAAEILDAALDLAERSSWSELSLSGLAEALKISPAELRRYYRDKDAISNAWFACAMDAMLAPTPANFAALPAAERLELLLLRWFDALASHRKVTGQMLRDKLTLAHPHHWVPMVFNLSRTVQWLRDAARLEAGGRRRQIEEVGLTALFLAVLAVWLGDDTPEQSRTRSFLKRRLAQTDRLMARCRPRRRQDDDGAEAA